MNQSLLSFISQATDIPSEEFYLKSLAGDASSREYYRVYFPQAAPYVTAILMCTQENTSQEISFLNVHRHLKKLKAHVPQIYAHAENYQFLLLEDLGDQLLQQAIQDKTEPEILRLYSLALEEIYKMQFHQNGKDCLAYQLAFDEEKLQWELDFFLKHTLRTEYRPAGSAFILPPSQSNKVKSCFLEISRYLAKQPRFFAHRDFHSRNLLVQNHQIRVIDFQDARMGPCQYDLVSLLFDSYADLSPSLISQLKEQYIQTFKENTSLPFSKEEFEKTFDWMKLQRSLKAAGTFSFIAHQKNNLNYLPYLPLVFRYALEVLEKYPEFKTAHHILANILNNSGVRIYSDPTLGEKRIYSDPTPGVKK